MNFALDQYAPYVWTSYAVFIAMLIWDFMMPQLRMRRVRRELTHQRRREAARVARTGAAS